MLNFLQNLAKIRKPETGLREGLLSSIKEMANGAKLRVSDCQNGFRLESGSGENAIAVVQFGGRREFYEMLETLEKEQVSYRAVITSSNVKSMRIGEMKWLLNNKYQTKNRWLIIDVEHREGPKTVNFMLYGGQKIPQPRVPGPETKGGEPETRLVGEEGYGSYPGQKERPRRKKIFGKRGEHKEQD